jgi:hypothetical protein
MSAIQEYLVSQMLWLLLQVAKCEGAELLAAPSDAAKTVVTQYQHQNNPQQDA